MGKFLGRLGLLLVGGFVLFMVVGLTLDSLFPPKDPREKIAEACAENFPTDAVQRADCVTALSLATLNQGRSDAMDRAASQAGVPLN